MKTILTISLTVHALMFFDYARDAIKTQLAHRKLQKYYEEEMQKYYEQDRREYEKKSDKSKQKQRRANKNVDTQEHNNW